VGDDELRGKYDTYEQIKQLQELSFESEE
jgi:hypothetical protein